VETIMPVTDEKIKPAATQRTTATTAPPGLPARQQLRPPPAKGEPRRSAPEMFINLAQAE
jgi:hypothetical protein